MALYRNVAGVGLLYDQTDTEGLDSTYTNTYFDPLPTTYTAIPAADSPKVYYDPGTPTVDSSAIPGVTVTDSGGTIPVHDPATTDFTDTDYEDFYTPPILPGPADTPKEGLPTSTTTATTPQVLPPDTPTNLKSSALSLLTLAGLLVVAIKGDDLLGKRRKIAYMGGLGLLYYTMSKNVTT